MIQSINGWTFLDPCADELGEGYPKRTIAIKNSKSSGKFTIKCYDFPNCKDFRVEMNNMDMSSKLDTFEDAVAFIKDFKQDGITGLNNNVMSFGGNNDMQIELGVNEKGEPTRNGKMIDFRAELDKLKQGGNIGDVALLGDVFV